MQIVEEALAAVEQSHAYQFEDVLLVRATGTKPTACHVVSLERSLLDVEPPTFVARLSTDPRVRCTPEPAPFEEQHAFRIGLPRPQIILHHGGGELTVDVEDLTPQLEGARAETEERIVPSIVDLGGEPGEAIGYSRSYDLGEAMRDAIDKLPAQGAAIPDWLSSYSVVSIGAQIGGIAGFNHLMVRVSG